ncbi:MAG: proline--tRNA ligase [Actinomycetota bacterium]|nr:proline--tRNA ligase [Actinomycetota bacterium]
MRWSSLFIPTLRDAPSDAEAASHALLVRAGFIRQLHAGHYTLLPLGLRVHQKVEAIVREEMNRIGGQEILAPAMHPASVWQRSGRWDAIGDEMFRLKDRRDADMVLGMTHEEVFALVSTELSSHRDVPQIWYQIQTKFRDEPRPRGGLLRVREFAMKDSYSFDLDQDGLDHAFELHRGAYQEIFRRLGLDAFGVEASSGAMGGSGSVEFMVASPAGEDDVVRCPSCGYAANVERATSAIAEVTDDPPPAEPERFPTPGVVTIAALEAFEGGAPANRQIKTLVMVADGEIVLAAVRGDHQLVDQKLADAIGANQVRPAQPEEVVAALGASPGSLGPVGVTDLKIVMDTALKGRTNMTTGANEDGWHWRGVDIERDTTVTQWADLRGVTDGEPCARCGEPLQLLVCIEAGHIFKLGTRYSEAMGATVLDADSKKRTLIMGSYGIGIGRAMAAVAESSHDDRGLIWPVSIAPYEAVVTLLDPKSEEAAGAAESIYDELRAAGVDAVLDDRDGRAGVKLTDAELVGLPFRIVVGRRGLANGTVEVVTRATGEKVDTPLADAATSVIELVNAART